MNVEIWLEMLPWLIKWNRNGNGQTPRIRRFLVESDNYFDIKSEIIDKEVQIIYGSRSTNDFEP